MARKIPGCGAVVDVSSQYPTKPVIYSRAEDLERTLGIGGYVAYPTYRRPGDFMFRLAVQKRILGRHGEAMEMLDSARSYLSSWKHCVSGHEGQVGTFCYSGDFRNLMRAQFEIADRLLGELEKFGEEDLRDFSRAIDFTNKWNLLQRTLRDTFFAHMAYYPAWLGDEGAPREKRINCADCHLFDAISPPAPAFVAMSAFFLPRSTSMPDGTPVPEGVLLHEKAGDFHEIHEHAHAYVHEKKSQGKRLGCEWIDEGIADWAAMTVTDAEKKDRSMYYEMYDFWLIVNSLSDFDRKELVRAWCHEPNKYDWETLVVDGVRLLREMRSTTRGELTWKMSDASDLKIVLGDYRK